MVRLYEFCALLHRGLQCKLKLCKVKQMFDNVISYVTTAMT